MPPPSRSPPVDGIRRLEHPSAATWLSVVLQSERLAHEARAVNRVYPTPRSTAPLVAGARSVVAVVVGLLLISMLVEAIEFGLVTVVHGAVTTDPTTYFSVRNRTWFLCLKLGYNTAAAFAGGIASGRLAGRASIGHGLALSAVQTLAFLWAFAQPEIGRSAPPWVWSALVALSVAGILAGARAASSRD